MRVVVQRVLSASVHVGNRLVTSIDKGYMLLVGICKTDSVKELEYVSKKISKLRIFSDDKGLMNLDIKKVKGSILSVSQFTLYGQTKKQNRPGFSNAMPFEEAKKMYFDFNELLRKEDIIVKEGVFGEDMKVSIINDGPVTIIIDTE